MRAWVALLIFGGCYSPAVPTGVPCDPAAPSCPGGQACVEVTAGTFTCGGTPGTPIDGPSGLPDADLDADVLEIDAPPDADPQDRDGDGVRNDLDNCPDDANATQANEDGDLLGDVCDPCPPYVDNEDLDHDGVGGTCDPHPDLGGDAIVVFEGFTEGIPTTWTVVGDWAADDGEAEIAARADVTSLLFPPQLAAAHSTVTMEVIPTAILGAVRGIGTGLPLSDEGSPGIACMLFVVTGNSTRGFGLIQTGGIGTPVDATAHAWALGETATLVQERTGDIQECRYLEPDLLSAGTYAAGATSTRMGVITVSIGARVPWLMYVTSP